MRVVAPFNLDTYIYIALNTNATWKFCYCAIPCPVTSPAPVSMQTFTPFWFYFVHTYGMKIGLYNPFEN